MIAPELADWLINFVIAGGRIKVTCNGMGILAENKEGRHWFTIMGYDEAEVIEMFDTLTPYL